MKALAASSIGQYETAVAALNDYYRTVELALSACLRQAAPTTPAPARNTKRGEAIGAVIFGSDQGLVGRFNEVLLEYAMRTLGPSPGKPARVVTVWTVGERMHGLTVDSGLTADSLLSLPNSVDGIASLVGRLLVEIETACEHREMGEILVFHNRPQSGSLYEPIGRKLLPLDQVWQNSLATFPWPSKNLPEIIEGDTPALPEFIQGYLFVLLFQACAESLASENASRLAAMQRAEKNIEGILDDLNRSFHSIRQEAIDEELFDVVSGFEALSARKSRT